MASAATTTTEGGLERRQSEYRADDIPAELYDTSRSRFSDASLFRRGADGGARTAFPYRTVFVALFLFLVGVGFLLLSLLHLWDRDRSLSIALLVVGSICFLPGAYAAYNLVQWARGAPGFHISDFAHWDDYRW